MTYPFNSMAFHGPSWVWPVWPAPALPLRDYADPHEFIQTTKTCRGEFEIFGRIFGWENTCRSSPGKRPPLHEGCATKVVLSNHPVEGAVRSKQSPRTAPRLAPDNDQADGTVLYHQPVLCIPISIYTRYRSGPGRKPSTFPSLQKPIPSRPTVPPGTIEDPPSGARSISCRTTLCLFPSPCFPLAFSGSSVCCLAFRTLRCRPGRSSFSYRMQEIPPTTTVGDFPAVGRA